MIRRIVSGGQTGAERGGFDAAIELDIPYGGWCPKGFLAEDGMVPLQYLPHYDQWVLHERRGFPPPRSFSSYADGGFAEIQRAGVRQTTRRSYGQATDMNVRSADATVVFFCDKPLRFSRRAVETAARLGRPCLQLRVDRLGEESQREFVTWLADNASAALNVTGDRESRCPGIYDVVKEFFVYALSFEPLAAEDARQQRGLGAGADSPGTPRRRRIPPPNVIPPGFEKCPRCGECRGTTLARHLDNWAKFKDPEAPVSATCICDGVLCSRCGKNRLRRPISNLYDPVANEVWHVPYLVAGLPCPECRDREVKR